MRPAAPTVTALGERLHLIAGVGGNVLALQGDEGLLLVDSGAPKQVKQLQSEPEVAGARREGAHRDQHALAPGPDRRQ